MVTCIFLGGLIRYLRLYVPNFVIFKLNIHPLEHLIVQLAVFYQRYVQFVVFDSYLESSIKVGERLLRVVGVVSVNLIRCRCHHTAAARQVWTSQINKSKLQQPAHRLVSTPELVKLTVVLNGSFTDEEIVTAQLLHEGRSSDSRTAETSASTEVLTCPEEEANDRLGLHCAWEVDGRSGRLLVTPNYIDSSALISLYLSVARERERERERETEREREREREWNSRIGCLNSLCPAGSLSYVNALENVAILYFSN